MAEVGSARANKLAAARKKLREFKQSRNLTRDVASEDKPHGNLGNAFHKKTSQIDDKVQNEMSNGNVISMKLEVSNKQYIPDSSNTENITKFVEQSFKPSPDVSVRGNSNGTGRLSHYFGSANGERQSRFVESNSEIETYSTHGEMNCAIDKSTTSPSALFKQVEKELQSVPDIGIKSKTDATQTMSDGLENQFAINELEKLRLINSELLEKLHVFEQEKEMNSLMSGPLKEQLQSQAQTIGILVAEKTELQSALSQSESAAKAKTGEVEELVTKIQQMNQQIQLLEHEIHQNEQSKASLQSNHVEVGSKLITLEKDLDKLRKEMKDKDEVHLELQNKLDKRNSEMSELQNRFVSTDNELQLCKIRICQLSSSDETESMSKMVQERSEIEKQLAYYKETFLKLEKEKEDIVNECNNQVEILRYHLQSSNKQVSELELESEKQSNSIRTLNSKVAELEERHSINKFEDAQIREEWLQEKADLVSKVNNLEIERKNLEEINVRMNEEIQSLQSTQRRFEEDVKYGQLMETMESDKVAASRATSQNLLLKKQNEEYETLNNSLSMKISELLEAAELRENYLSQCQDEVQELQDLTTTLRQELVNEKEKKSSAQEYSKYNGQTSEHISGDTSGSVSVEEYCKLQLAMEALEGKFNDSIRKVATLTEEKHLLEHLVTQLHSETETIEEYIALYRMQRGLLRQKAEEKDQIIQQISQDRELLRTKLARLEDLVNSLSGGQKSIAEIIPEIETHDGSGTDHVDTAHIDTTKQIKALLSEIGASSILHNSLVSETFHPCSLCSGRLLHL